MSWKFEIEEETTVVEKKEERDEVDIKLPSMWDVVFLNDDYTTVDFVIEVLQRYFHHSLEDAILITAEVHQYGSGVAGTYSKDIAETKSAIVTSEARKEGFPLLVVIRKHEE